MPERNGVPQQTLNTIFEKLGNVEACAREAKHAANNAGQKIDAVAGKVDALALVVATQGQLRDHVDRLERAIVEHQDKLEDLQADKHRREGALGIVSWFARNWPLTVIFAALAALVAWANGRLGG